MANKSVSQLDEATSIADDDIVLISQKQPNGKYISKRASAELLKGLKGDPGVSVAGITIVESQGE